MNTSSKLVEILTTLGVERVYGIPGDAINSLIEAIRRQSVIQFIQVRHEEAGAFAAVAEAKLTGKLAVCVGTAGPGAVHLLNPLYDARMDGAPVLAITGQVATRHIGSHYHQEIDLYTLFKDATVFNETVVSVEQMPNIAIHACQAAIAKRGPAHLSLPADIADARVASGADAHQVFLNRAQTTPCDGELQEAANLLNKSDRVVILAGAGCRDAGKELVALSESLGAPIIKALRGKDILPDEHPNVIGGLGLLGVKPAVDAIDHADALLMIGTDFPYRNFLPKATPAIQIDIDPDRLGRRYPIALGLLGHAKPTIQALCALLHVKDNRSFLQEHQDGMRRWFTEMEKVESSDDTPIRPQRVANALGRLASDDAIFCCDTGAVTVWGARNLRLRDQQRFTLSSSLASMAYAMPASIGAQLAYPDRQVIALAGDGSIGMLLGDFLTLVKYELPVTIVVFNNSKLGLIQMEQEVQGYPEHETGLHNPDFAEFAKLCGGQGRTVTSPDELDDALLWALSNGKPTMLNVIINPEERTMPPKIELNQAWGFGIAKVREFFGAGDASGGEHKS
ncbi:MAG: thiamine pyrophosphate-dependent enzyme [Phycisphaerales bacterium]